MQAADPIFVGRLTKSIVLALHNEAYLISGVCHGDGTPLFSGMAGGMSDRELLWQRLVRMRVSGRRVKIFANENTGQAEVNRLRELHAKLYPERERA